ncbi:MAG: nucleotidyl transferase AbiEii/AbiGii toxin family protein [Desulfobulbus sp.]|nr:nucleotidyl transferase AbiEii/AbiGii toxin family protein [Desulfobulbus sp.]
MNNISIDISDKIDPERVAVLRSIKDVAEALNIPFFVVGAFAREVIFEYIHQIPSPRITEDIDIGVEVASWEEFQVLKTTLLERKILTATKTHHRFVTNKSSIIVDILPYGGITDETKQISWPPDHDMVMSMMGFEEAYRSALNVRLSNKPVLEIPLPSVPALAILKLVSWNDAYPTRERDAQDLLFILENYDATGIEAQLYDAYIPLLTEEEYDTKLASVRLLGRDIAHLCGPETLNTLTTILNREKDEDQGFRLLIQMVKGTSFQGVKFNAALQLLKKLLQGILEAK